METLRSDEQAEDDEVRPPSAISKVSVETTTTRKSITILSVHSSSLSQPLDCAEYTTQPSTQLHSGESDSLLLGDISIPDIVAFPKRAKLISSFESVSTSYSPSIIPNIAPSTSGDSLYRSFTSGSSLSPVRSGSPHHSSLPMDEWKFNKTHQYHTKSGFYRSISQYDNHIKEIRGECICYEYYLTAPQV